MVYRKKDEQEKVVTTEEVMELLRTTWFKLGFRAGLKAAEAGENVNYMELYKKIKGH